MKNVLSVLLFCFFALLPAGARQKFFPSGDSLIKVSVLEGRIMNYRPDSCPQSGLIYLDDVVTEEDFPKAVRIKPDGTFRCLLPLSNPMAGYIVLEDDILPFYIEPGGRLSMKFALDKVRGFDWEGLIEYEGDEAQTARQLNDYPVTLFGERDVRHGLDHLQPLEMRDYMMGKLRTALARVDSLRAAVPLTGKAARLMEYETRLRAGEVLFTYVNRMIPFLDKKGHREKIPGEYYAFLREMPLDDPFALAALSYDSFVNRLEFSFISYYAHELGHVVKAGDSTKLARMCSYLEKTDSFLRANCGIDFPATLTGRILRVHSARWMLQNMPGIPECRSLCDVLLPATAERRLRRALEDCFTATCYPQTFLPQELPDGPGADIIRRIIAPHRGRYVLIDFWGTSCGPCRQGIEESTEQRQAFKDSPDLVFVYITGTSDSPSEKAYADYAEKHLLGYPHHRLPQDEYNYLRELFRFNGIPHYVVFDREGRLLSNKYDFFAGSRLERDLKKWKEAGKEQ